jgi:PAT family beta-lactamase induction signal transducer AmpG
MSEPILEVTNQPKPWYVYRSVWVMLFLGFSAGVPLYLVFSSLSLWLREAGVERATVTFFSWAVLGYSFKFMWAPLVDRIPIAVLSRCLGRRRSWLLCSQLAVISAIVLMASSDPATNLTQMALGAVLLGFSSATQDIVIDAYRIESGEPELQALMSSTYVVGYRVGMMVAGAWALLLAEQLGSSASQYSYQAWQTTYLIMAIVMCVGIVTTLVIREPKNTRTFDHAFSSQDYARFLGVFVGVVTVFIIVYNTCRELTSRMNTSLHLLEFGLSTLSMVTALAVAVYVAWLCAKSNLVNKKMVKEAYFSPFTDFFVRFGRHAIWLVLLICFYRVSDIVLGVISNLFYQDMGYSKSQIATVTKLFGVVVTIIGALLGGIIALRLGVMRSLLFGAIVVSVTNLSFLWLANLGAQHSFVSLSIPYLTDGAISIPLELTLVIVVDNLAQGLAIAAFIGWLSSLTNIAFSATQYAVFSSLMTLLPKFFGGYSGMVVDWVGYQWFFIGASLLGVPVILLVLYVSRFELTQAKR